MLSFNRDSFISQGMLGSPTVAVRIRAFDLVLNLGVHAHLLEPMPGEETTIGGEIGSTLRSASGKTLGGDENGVSERHLPSGVPGSATAMKASSSSGQRTPAAVGQFEAWLLDILCEMMLFLHQVITSCGDLTFYCSGHQTRWCVPTRLTDICVCI